MTRLGGLLLIAFLVVIGVFAVIVRKGGPSSVVQPSSITSPAAAPASRPQATAGGRLVIPVSGVKRDQLQDSWGDARGDGTREHHAIDILAPRGTPVVAAAAGTIEKIFESKNGGHTVYVRRDDQGFVDYYAHLDRYAPNLAAGEKIAQGRLLGAVGSTGDASAEAPHLHYAIKRMGAGEAWWQGTEIDPYPILAGKAAER